jgi:hypothetical protein
MKTNATYLQLSSTDQAVLLSIPTISFIFLPIMIGISWTRIKFLRFQIKQYASEGEKFFFEGRPVYKTLKKAKMSFKEGNVYH